MLQVYHEDCRGLLPAPGKGSGYVPRTKQGDSCRLPPVSDQPQEQGT